MADIKHAKIRIRDKDYGRAAIVGFLSGLSVAITGAIKDAPYEGFDPVKFIRSPIVGAIEGPALLKGFGEMHPLLLYFSTIATERLTVEAYKLARAQMPGKFVNGEWGIPK